MKILNRRYDPACPLASIQPHPRNPRQGDAGAIFESIEENGFWGAILVQESTGYIVAGNHRYLSVQAEGSAHMPVIFADIDDETALKILLADNRIGDLGSYDMNALAELVDSVRSNTGLVGTGWDEEALENLLSDLSGIALGSLSGEPAEKKQAAARADEIVRPEMIEGPNAVIKTPVEGEPPPPPGEVKSIDPAATAAAPVDPNAPVAPGPDSPGAPDGARYKEQYAVIVTCDSEQHQEQVFTALSEAGYVCKVVCT